MKKNFSEYLVDNGEPFKTVLKIIAAVFSLSIVLFTFMAFGG